MEYEKANRKSTESDPYHNSFGAAKEGHFIFTYTNKTQSFNSHFVLPSETHTFFTNTCRAGFTATILFTMPDINTASPDNFRATVLRQLD